MSSSASSIARAARLFEAPIGKKAVMAVTGLALFGFVIGHMLGNLQIYLPPGPDGKYAIDAYGEALHANTALLYGARIGLLLALAAHIISAIQLAQLKNAARPSAYVRHTPIASSYASRTMYWSGPILLAFLIYHLLHFTTGHAHPDFQFLHVHDNVVRGFSVWYVSLFYIVAMGMLCMHLYHGIWSLFQSLGFSHPTYTPRLKLAAKAAAVLVAAGNISIPLSVLAGIVK
ncbi:MAG TPA: succinate dehydrogenase cytochrome b subunit [Bryobacteraceae bacterium]|nr:succinate dehydrogenase cytochrome b subunit [Bryobacteraceae bacterium]